MKKDLTPSTVPGRRRPLSLFWVIAGTPIVLLFLAFLLVNNPTYRKYAGVYWIEAQSGLFQASHRNCSVLIYGDSTAMAGLDPEMIAHATGMSVCNIASTGGVLQILGLDPLNRYLARNPRPRFLILQFSADNLQPEPIHTRSMTSFDGYVQFMRYEPWTRTFEQMLRYPDSFTGLLHFVYDEGSRNLFKRLTGVKSTDPELNAGSYIVHNAPGLRQCVPRPDIPDSPDPQWIRRLRNTYSVKADQLLIDVSPLPGCYSYIPRWRAQLHGLTDNPLELYPLADFIDDEHMTRNGALRRSAEVAQQILDAEHKLPGVTSQRAGR